MYTICIGPVCIPLSALLPFLLLLLQRFWQRLAERLGLAKKQDVKAKQDPPLKQTESRSRRWDGKTGVNLLQSESQLAATLSDADACSVNTLVRFYAKDGCCQVIDPVLEKLVMGYDGAFVAIDARHMKEVAEAYKIVALPTYIVFQQGRDIARLEGQQPDKLRALVERYFYSVAELQAGGSGGGPAS